MIAVLQTTTGALEVSFEAELYDNNSVASYITLDVKSPHSAVNKQYPYVAAVRGFYNSGDGNLNATSRK